MKTVLSDYVFDNSINDKGDTGFAMTEIVIQLMIINMISLLIITNEHHQLL